MPPHADDLLRRSARGDEGAFAQFYDETSPRTLRLARVLLDDEGEVEDAVHQAYLTAWRTAPTYAASTGRGASGWVLAILQERARPPGRAGRPGPPWHTPS